MIYQSIVSSQSQLFFKLERKAPILITFMALFFIYVLQYPIKLLFVNTEQIVQYELIEWFSAYVFVVASAAVFVISLYLGMSGRSIRISPRTMRNKGSARRIGFISVIVIFSVFALWSYFMLKLNIGITIWSNFESLPFRLAGILFYGRLFVQPIVLSYIALNYVDSRLKWVVYLLIVTLGAWVSLSSGSRFAGILFAAPLFFLFRGKARYIATLPPVLAFIVITTVSRSFYLPMVIGDPELIAIYANEAHQASTIENLWLLPLAYIVVRVMGISEVMLTFNYGRITPGFFDSLQVFLSKFMPFISPGSTVSVKNIYGFDDDAFGGLGLDIFSNFWVMSGGEAILYGIGLGLVGWALGKCYRLVALGLARFGIIGMDVLAFVLLFILIFEGRVHLMPLILFVAWVFSRKSTSNTVFVAIKLLVPSRPLRLRRLTPAG